MPRCHRIIAIALVGLMASLSEAQEKPAEKEGAKPPVSKKEETDKPSLLDKLSKELFKDLDEEAAKAPAAQKENKLDRVAQGMRNAGNKLGENQTGKDTRQIQEQVIRDLDDLIKQMENPPPNGGGGGGGGGASSSRTSSGGASGQRLQKMSSDSTPQNQQGKPLNGQGMDKAGEREKKVAEGSQERSDSERKAAEEAARKKKLEMDVWGHLPPHLRDQLLNTYGERMLPKYQQLVKQFYEALSEQNDAPRR